MSDQRIDSGTEDTRATDFVFGELSAEETTRFERELEQSPELQAEVESIREAVAAVQTELASDSRGVNDAGRRSIEDAIAGGSDDVPAVAGTVQPFTGIDNTRRVLIGIAVAASVLVIAALAIPRFQRPHSITKVEPIVDQTSAETEPMASEDATVESELKQLVEKKRSPEPGMMLGTQKKSPESPSVSNFDTGLAQSTAQLAPTGDQDAAPLSGKMERRQGQQSGATDMSSLRAALPMKPSEPSSQVDSYGVQMDLPDLQPQSQAPSPHPFGQELAEGIAHPSGGDQSPKPDSAPTPESALALSAASDPFGSPAPAEKAGEAQLPDDAFGALAQSQPQSMFRGVVELKAKTSDSKKQEAAGRYAKIAGDRIVRDVDRRGGARVTTQANGAAGGGQASVRGMDIVSRSREPGQPPLRESVLDAGMMIMGGVGPGMSGDKHDPITDNPFKEVLQSPLSTFSIDVDTASYAKVRMYLMQHQMLPRPDAVRIEELVNYFTYDYQPPKQTDEHPFAATATVASCPWNGKHRLARVAIKGRVIEDERPPSNLVFLLDVSGSMNRPNKLPLVIEGMKMLTKQLEENDSVAIVVYAGAAGLVLDSTCGDEKDTILGALERLRAGGSTNGGQGIQLAYQTARDNFITGGTNRVILCTDGDFNVGVTGTDQLVRIAEENAKGDIFLSVLGFGMGNHNDAMMEQISNKGNGNYAFIDSKKEAQKVLVEQMGGTLVTIAKDVKIQIEFNPQEVAAYRLIGYENRMLAAQDFNDDTRDAGEIGAGHTVTAFYELVPGDGEVDIDVPSVDDLRYQKKSKLSKQADSGELLALKLRYKQPTGTKSTLIEVPVEDTGKSFSAMDADFKFAASVASFGMLLRKSPHKGDSTFAAVEEIAGDGIGKDNSGRRTEFLQMVAKAKELSGE